MNRRNASRLLVAAALVFPSLVHAAEPVVEVYKTATCGCCTAWIKHLESNGFSVRAHNVEDPGLIRAKGGIPAKYGSCHTAKIGKYTVEGHVPAADIKRLLASKADAAGLSVPGMPMGSPGMEGPHRDEYEVLLIKDGKATVYSRQR